MSLRLFDNLWLKLLSLVLGFALWYVVAGEKGAEIVLSVPIEFRNVEEGLEILKESVQQVEVRLRGSSEIVRGLTPSEIQVSVDLSDAGPGERTVYLDADQVKAPFGVRVTRIRPAGLQVVLDDTVDLKVRVMPRVVGAPAAGFELKGVRIEPDIVRLSGPASRLKGVEQVTTEPISAQGLREPYTRPAQVLLEDPLIRVAGMGKVVATLDVREEQVTVELSGVRVTLAPERAAASVTPSSVRVTLSLARSKKDQLHGEDLEAVGSVEGLGEGTHEVEVEVKPRQPDLPAFEVLSVKPPRVKVRMSPQPERSASAASRGASVGPHDLVGAVSR